MAVTPVILRILVTGICAVVPSAKDKDVNRIIAPKAVNASMVNHNIPDHFPFIEVKVKNLKSPPNRPIDFQFHPSGDPDPKDHLIFILQSERIELKTQPTNTTLTQNTEKPADLTVPNQDNQHPNEPQSTIYELKMADACPKCGPLQDAYFDVMKNPDLVGLRMDLRGGRESTQNTKFTKVWTFRGSQVKQPLAQDMVFEFDIPSDTETLILTRAGDGKVTQVELFSPDNQPIEVTVGNEPLRDVLLLDKTFPPMPGNFHDHFPLIYNMFSTIPPNPPLPELVPKAAGPVRGPGDDCIPPKPAPQDPAQ